MQLPLALFLSELRLRRRLLSLRLPKNYLSFQDAIGARSQEPGMPLISGSSRARGLGLSWWAENLYENHTLLLQTNLKEYSLGFDRSLLSQKDVFALRRRRRLKLIRQTTALDRQVGWLGTPLSRELGSWGGSSSHRYQGWLSGLYATRWSQTRAELHPLLRRSGASWLAYRPAEFLLWAWAALPTAGGQSRFASLLAPQLELAEVEEAGPWTPALLWYEPYDGTAFMLDSFETWSLNERARVFRAELPSHLALWNSTLHFKEFQPEQVIPLWGVVAWALFLEQGVVGLRGASGLGYRRLRALPFRRALVLSLQSLSVG